jgi:hypothetical protein
MQTKRGNEARSAGLPLSVGSASFGVRLFLALSFAVVALLCIGAGVLIARSGNLAATVIAILAVVPLGCIAAIAAAFVLAPFSRFGIWLDAFVPTVVGMRAALVVAAFWLTSALIVIAGR